MNDKNDMTSIEIAESAPTEQLKILIVDDKEANLFALKKVLKNIDAEIVQALSGEEALAAALMHDFALMILDVQMPGMDGYELATYFQGDPRTQTVPIIFVTAINPNDLNLFKGYEAGAIDFIFKPYPPVVLIAKVKILLEMQQDKLELNRHHAEMEKLIGERTTELLESNAKLLRSAKELEATNQALESSRLAALNMMEDAVQAKEKLELTQFSLDHAGDPAYWVDSEARLVYVNEAACQTLGYSRQELLNLTVPDIDPNYSMEHWPAYWKASKRNRFSKLESQHQSRDGHIFPVEIHTSLVEYGDREYNCIFAHDISSRKKSEQALERSESKYRRLFEQSADAYLIIKDGRFVDCNPAAVQMLLYNTKEQLLNAHPSELSPETQPDGQNSREKADAIMQHMANEENLRIEWIHQRANGEVFPVEVSLTAITDSEGNPIIHVTWRDITDRKAAQQAIEDSRRFLRTIIDTIPIRVFWKDTNSTYLGGNKAFVGDAGMDTSDELPGRTDFDLPWASDQAEQYRADDQAVMQSGASKINYEESQTTPTGETIWLSTSKVPLTNAEGNIIGVLGSYENITERKRLQEAIEKQILALTRPMQDSGKIEFEELFSLVEIQRIQDDFAEATGVASIITLVDGTPVTQPSNFTDLCADIIRKTEKGCINCFKSDAIIGRHHPEGPIVQCCMSGGLWDAGASIEVGGQHIANWLIGQVRDETQTDESMRAYAREIEADEEQFMNAFYRVPVMSQDQFQKIAKMLYSLARQLSTSAYQNIQQARFISAQKEAEKTLKEMTHIQSLILDSSTLGIALVENRTFKWVNSRLCELLGIPEKELQDASTQILYPTEEEFLKVGKIVYEQMGRGARADHTLQFQRHDGSLFWCRLIGKALSPDSAIEAGSLWMFEDISNRIDAEMELTRLYTAIEQTPETIVITDLEGTIQYVNSTFEIVTGYSREETLGQNPRHLNSGEHSASFFREMWQTISSGQIWEGRMINRRRNGQLFTEDATIAPVKDATGEIVNYVAVKRDITEELIREEELRQVQKMDAVGQLAGGIAHDFNNILQGIQGFSEILEMTLDEGSQNHANANEITKAAKRAAELTKQLLAFSRKQPAQFEKLDLNKVIYDTQALFTMLLGERHEVLFELDPHLPPIMSDHSQLTQVIINLAVNARDAMEGDGHFSISTECEQLDDDDATLTPEAKPGHYVVLSVSDSGCGMEEDVVLRLFEPFFTTKEVGSGTGLGLAVVYGIVKQNKGWINVHSEIDKGTCFKIYFPVVDPLDKDIDSEQPHQLPSTHVLIVEDNPGVSGMIQETLSTIGFKTETASNAEDGLALFRESDEPYDILLSDMELPGMQGDELANLIRETHPDLPILLFSGYREHIDRQNQFNLEKSAFIKKPFTTTRLLDIIMTLLNY